MEPKTQFQKMRDNRSRSQRIKNIEVQRRCTAIAEQQRIWYDRDKAKSAAFMHEFVDNFQTDFHRFPED